MLEFKFKKIFFAFFFFCFFLFSQNVLALTTSTTSKVKINQSTLSRIISSILKKRYTMTTGILGNPSTSTPFMTKLRNFGMPPSLTNNPTSPQGGLLNGAGPSAGANNPGYNQANNQTQMPPANNQGNNQTQSPPPGGQDYGNGQTPVDCNGKKNIVVGFRGLPNRGVGPNSSDGVDSAVAQEKGRVFEYNEQLNAVQYILSKVGSDLNGSVVTIVGHSAGANTAIALAKELINKNIKIVGLVLADPSRGIAQTIPSGIPHVVGIISGSPAYQGLRLNTGQTIDRPNMNHFQVDNLIEKNLPNCGK